MKLKKLFVFAIALLITGCGTTKNLKIGLEKSSLQGKIKQMKVSVYNAENLFGEIKKNGLKYMTVVKLDREGLITEEKKYRENGRLHSYKKYEFDAHGNALRITELGTTGNLRSSKIYKYNDHGNVMGENSYSVKKRFLFGKYKRHDYISKYSYIKTDRGLMVREELDPCPDGICGKTTNVYQYNHDGKLIEKKYEGNQYNDCSFFHVTVKYDDHGNIIMEKVVADDKKNQKKLNSSSAGSLNAVYKYKYDEEGNWKRRLTMKNGKPYTIIEREITYY